MSISKGDKLPAFKLPTDDGGSISPAELAGRPAVIYFYPKADTPGCTREAQDFSALVDDFAAAAAVVVGVSKDPPARLGKFATKHDLTIRLASDDTGAVCDAFGVWGEKQLYGRTYMGIERATFLFAADGRLVRAWRKVKVPGHAEAVLQAVRGLAEPR